MAVGSNVAVGSKVVSDIKSVAVGVDVSADATLLGVGLPLISELQPRKHKTIIIVITTNPAMTPIKAKMFFLSLILESDLFCIIKSTPFICT